jgi:hypothetical protein
VNQGQAKEKTNSKYHVRCYVNIPGSNNVPIGIKRLLDRGERRHTSTRGRV